MKLNSLTNVLLAGIVISMVLMFSGCDNGPPGAKFNTTNARRLRTAYNIFSRLHNLKGPTSEDELKEFLKSDLTAKVRLERIGVTLDQIDGLFISERDGKPFKVRYGLNGASDQPVVFEEEGVDGKRFVALWKPEEVEAAEYEAYWSGKKKKSAENINK